MSQINEQSEWVKWVSQSNVSSEYMWGKSEGIKLDVWMSQVDVWVKPVRQVIESSEWVEWVSQVS